MIIGWITQMILENDDALANFDKRPHNRESYPEIRCQSTQAIIAFENTHNYDKKTFDRTVIMGEFSMSDIHFLSNEVLDSQHALILSCMSNVHEYLSVGVKGRDLFEVVDRLDAYCKLHFLEEEKVLEEIDFPEINDHKAQHALFLTHLESFMGKTEDRNREYNTKELNFLKEWFLEHILAFDKTYSERKFRSDETPLGLGH